DGDGIEIRLALRATPREEAMTAEHNAIAAGYFFYRAFKHHCQLKAGPLPGNPHQLVSELPVELFHLFFTICRGGERDSPVGMKMIYVCEGQKRMQGRTGRCSYRVVIKCANGM